MVSFEEKRDSKRLAVSCEIYCRPLDDEHSYPAECITLSNSGVSFICQRTFEVGEVIEVSIHRLSMPALKFFVNVVRYRMLDNNLFEIGATLQLTEQQ